MTNEVKAIIAELTRLHGELDVKLSDRGGAIGFARSFKCPLDFYERHEHVTPEQHSAGLELASLYFQAFGKSGSVQGNYAPRSGGRRTDFFNPAVWKYLKAYQAVRGTREREICVKVCCYDLKAGERGEMVYLKSALDDLSRHFRRR